MCIFLVVESVVYVDVPRGRFIFIHAYVVLLLLTHSFNFYRSPIKLREGNVFADVCHSVHNGGRAITQCVLPLYLTPLTIPLGPYSPQGPYLPQDQTPGTIPLCPTTFHDRTPPRDHTQSEHAGATHPTGMSSCFKRSVRRVP